jgi:hypothetical protein
VPLEVALRHPIAPSCPGSSLTSSAVTMSTTVPSSGPSSVRLTPTAVPPRAVKSLRPMVTVPASATDLTTIP